MSVPTKKLSDVPEFGEKATVQDFCNQGCLQRLQIRDQQTERLEKSLQRLESIMEALTSILAQSHPEAFQKEINILTARILRMKTKGLQGNGKDKEISAWD